MEIVEFLRARLDEVELRAVKAQAVVRHLWKDWVITSGEASEHLVINADPARVLREVEAKRRILDEHLPRLTGFISGRPGETAEELRQRFDERTEMVCPVCVAVPHGPVPAPCPTLRLLVLPDDQHPDYQSEWKP